MILDKKTINNILSMYTGYKKTEMLSPEEYIQDMTEKRTLDPLEIQVFLEITRHQPLLEIFMARFLQRRFLGRVNQCQAELLLYLLVFVLNEENLKVILNWCLEAKCFYLGDLVAAMIDPKQQAFIYQTSCEYFEDDYVLSKIIDPFLSNISIIVRLGREYLEIHEIKPIPSTKPKPFTFLDEFSGRRPHPPANTPAVARKFRSLRAPSTTWARETFNDKRLLKFKAQNRQRAEQLLLEASKMPERLTKTKERRSYAETTTVKTFKSKPRPDFKSVEIKSNLTTTLREASRIIKNKEGEMKQIDDLVKGGFSKENIEKLEEDLKKEQELKELELIEKNHLKGLLSHEEAIIAKRKLLDSNKQKMQQFKEEKIELVHALDLWRQQEEQKIRSLVEKSQTIKQNAKESEKRLLEAKQQKVRLQQHQTRQMLDQALAEQNRELQRKIKLIHEIKALHRVRCNIKEFDPTETPNLGLLCEMSIAELQERLAITRMNMQQELEEKRRGILKRKEDHRAMIENVKKLISENRASKSTTFSSNPPELKESPDLVELRKRLEEKRRLRNTLQ